jgi:hypothetical protein
VRNLFNHTLLFYQPVVCKRKDGRAGALDYMKYRLEVFKPLKEAGMALVTQTLTGKVRMVPAVEDESGP